MNILKTTARAVGKRPFILVLIGILMLAAAIANASIPVMAMMIGIVNMTSAGVFESLLSVLQMLIDPGIIPMLLKLLAVLAILSSIAAGLLLPGYLLIVDDGMAMGRKKKGLFLEGLKSYFFKFFFITLKTVLFTAFFVIFLMVASVPAIIVTRAAFTTKPDLLLGALFIDLVTAGVFLMCLSFFKAYVYMWYIAASKGEKSPFKNGKAVAERQFGRLALGLLVFDVIFVAVIFLIYLSDNQFFRYTAGWASATVIFTTLAVYLVQAYKAGADNSQN